MSALLTMNFRINSGHTRGHEAVSWQKSDTGFCGCSSFDFFDDRAGTYENRVDSAAEGICPDSHMSYEDVSCKSTGVCRNRRSTYKADQSPYFSGAEQRVSGWQYVPESEIS